MVFVKVNKGRNICIDATNQLTLQANKIQLGVMFNQGKLKIFKLHQQGVDLGKPFLEG